MKKIKLDVTKLTLKERLIFEYKEYIANKFPTEELGVSYLTHYIKWKEKDFLISQTELSDKDYLTFIANTIPLSVSEDDYVDENMWIENVFTEYHFFERFFWNTTLSQKEFVKKTINLLLELIKLDYQYFKENLESKSLAEMIPCYFDTASSFWNKRYGLENVVVFDLWEILEYFVKENIDNVYIVSILKFSYLEKDLHIWVDSSYWYGLFKEICNKVINVYKKNKELKNHDRFIYRKFELNSHEVIRIIHSLIRAFWIDSKSCEEVFWNSFRDFLKKNKSVISDTFYPFPNAWTFIFDFNNRIEDFLTSNWFTDVETAKYLSKYTTKFIQACFMLWISKDECLTELVSNHLFSNVDKDLSWYQDQQHKLVSLLKVVGQILDLLYDSCYQISKNFKDEVVLTSYKNLYKHYQEISKLILENINENQDESLNLITISIINSLNFSVQVLKNDNISHHTLFNKDRNFLTKLTTWNSFDTEKKKLIDGFSDELTKTIIECLRKIRIKDYQFYDTLYDEVLKSLNLAKGFKLGRKVIETLKSNNELEIMKDKFSNLDMFKFPN